MGCGGAGRLGRTRLPWKSLLCREITGKRREKESRRATEPEIRARIQSLTGRIPTQTNREQSQRDQRNLLADQGLRRQKQGSAPVPGICEV